MKLAHAIVLALSLFVAAACKGSAAASGAAAPAPAGEGLELPPPPAPRVGDRATNAEDVSMKMTIQESPDRSVEMVVRKHTEAAREVLAVDGDAITRIKVGYTAHEESRALGGGETKHMPSPLVGKTFIVWREGGELKATLEDGSVPSGEALAEVLDDNGTLGLPPALELIISGKTWKTGEKVVFTPEELARLNERPAANDRPGEEQFASMALTLTGVEGNVASFAMELGIEMKSDKGSMTMSLTGTARIDVTTGRRLELGGAGPVKGEMGLPVTGTMTMKTVYTY